MSKPPSLLRNPLGILGLCLAAVSTAFGLPLFLLDLFGRRTHPYFAVVVYLVLPFVAIVGVAVALLGVLWERRRRRRHPGLAAPPLPMIDLNRPVHQAMVLGGATAVMTLVVLLSITGYRAYHFTESVKFCGLVCHQVMKPEYTAHQHSPHARVACVACHVGSGAEWFVRAKLNGLHQVYTLATHQYPRPVPSPVKNLRPATDTCEQCHWPAKFFGEQQKVFAHTLADEANSPWRIQMLMNVGGGDPATGQAAGIHWHMNIKNAIYYRAADDRREVIPWVRVVGPDGAVTEYVSTESASPPDQLARREIRRMDCVDCHNRPTHLFHPPDQALDAAFEAGRLDRRLPYLKREGVRLLAASYPSEAKALSAIQDGLQAFYRTRYPDAARDQPEAIRQAAVVLGELYAANVFPEMRTDWRAHPDHIGHLNADGCFRCHDGLHRSREGRVITNDCGTCHTILAQGPPGEAVSSTLQAQLFRHPVDMGMDVTQLKCSQCHDGTTVAE